MPDVGSMGESSKDDSISFVSTQVQSEGKGALILVAGLITIVVILVFALGVYVGAHLPN